MEVFFFEGEWNDGFLQINDSVYIEIDDGYIYVNELRSGFFGCFKRMKRSSLYKYPSYKHIVNHSELTDILDDFFSRLSVSELVIERGCGNELKIDLKICGFENLN